MNTTKPYRITRERPFFATIGVITLCLVVGLYLHSSRSVLATDNNFADGITVDSTGDGADANLGDSICDDGTGNCTLRAAIEESNQEAGTQTIRFNITGTTDFTNGGQNGYSIKPNLALPNITSTTIIDGYSQPGAAVNTAVAPEPLDGRLLIELDGASVSTPGVSGIEISGAPDVVVKGLVIGGWSSAGIRVNGDSAKIEGNYIGTDYSGSAANGNEGNGVEGWGDGADSVYIGGLLPAARNLISGNPGAGMGLGPNHDNWTIQGNYIGIASDGITALPNAQPGGSGNPSLDYVTGTLVGGHDVGAANVISGNNGIGIAPDWSTDTNIIGNYIGTDYSGTVAVPNGHGGVAIANGETALIEDNIISGNVRDGIYSQNFNNLDIRGNKIGTGSGGGEALGNGQAGVSLENTTVVSIGGINLGDSNTISNNTQQGVVLVNDNNQLTTIIGNSISNNGDLGIDIKGDGVSENDSLDVDSGPNNLLNYPIYDFTSESGGNTDVHYRLDVPAGDYRIEFYSNTAADPSGNGEGETYLGFQNITHPGGGIVTYTHNLIGQVGITNLALTATERNVDSATGFGDTSEFGDQITPNTDLAITKTLLNPEDVAPGATLQYEITVTNEGWTLASLSSLGSVGAGQALFYDFTPPELSNAKPYVSDGPIPGSSYVDVSNPDLTCLWAVGAVGAFFGSEKYADYGLLLCWFTGENTNLLPGESITANFTLDLSNDSDLVFNNYAAVSYLTDDPDSSAITEEVSSIYNDKFPDFVIESTSDINNITVSQFPAPLFPSEPSSPTTPSVQSLNKNSLAKTGQDVLKTTLVGIFLVSVGGAVSVARSKYVRYSRPR